MPKERSINIFTNRGVEAAIEGADKLNEVLAEMQRRDTEPSPITDTLGHAANFDVFMIVPTREVEPEVIEAMMKPLGDFQGFN